MIIAVKLLTALFAILWIHRTYQAVRLGRTERIDQKFARRGWIPEKHREKAIAAYRYLACTIAGATLVRLLSRPAKSGVERVTFVIHLPCAVILLVVMTGMLYYKSGVRDAPVHRRLAKVVIVLSPIVFVTGMMLIMMA